MKTSWLRTVGDVTHCSALPSPRLRTALPRAGYLAMCWAEGLLTYCSMFHAPVWVKQNTHCDTHPFQCPRVRRADLRCTAHCKLLRCGNADQIPTKVLSSTPQLVLPLILRSLQRAKTWCDPSALCSRWDGHHTCCLQDPILLVHPTFRTGYKSASLKHTHGLTAFSTCGQ